MKNDWYTNKIRTELDANNPVYDNPDGLRLLAEIEGVLPKPIILYDGHTKDEEEAKKGKVSLWSKIINKKKQYEKE